MPRALTAGADSDVGEMQAITAEIEAMTTTISDSTAALDTDAVNAATAACRAAG